MSKRELDKHEQHEADALLERLEASQKACFDAGLHVAAMDIQTARAELIRLRSIAA